MTYVEYNLRKYFNDRHLNIHGNNSVCIRNSENVFG